jgi:hypothetical protein
MWVSIKSSIGFGSRPKTLVCKRKVLLVKHFHIKIQFKKNICNKTKSYHLLRMWNKQNEPASVRGNWTTNLSVLVVRTWLRSLHKTLRRHVLDISFLDSFWDMQMSEIPLYGHVFPAWKTYFFFFCIFLWFFCASYHKSRNLYGRNKLSWLFIMKNKIWTF